MPLINPTAWPPQAIAALIEAHLARCPAMTARLAVDAFPVLCHSPGYRAACRPAYRLLSNTLPGKIGLHALAD